jgi:hypothetical protein
MVIQLVDCQVQFVGHATWKLSGVGLGFVHVLKDFHCCYSVNAEFLALPEPLEEFPFKPCGMACGEIIDVEMVYNSSVIEKERTDHK